jgi:hypothetical protein
MLESGRSMSELDLFIGIEFNSNEKSRVRIAGNQRHDTFRLLIIVVDKTS